MSLSRFHPPLLVWSGWLLVLLLLRFGPEPLRGRLQSGFREGLGVALAACSSHAADHDRPQADAVLSEEDLLSERLERLMAENRELKRLTSQLREELNHNTPDVAAPAAEPDRLMKATSLTARVLGVQGDDARSNKQLYLALGSRSGLLGEELVLKGPGVLIDLGRDQRLNADQLVTAGQVLFGRTQTVGRWTSLVQPVTDPEFRIAARIVRDSPLGPVLGPRGILSGAGTGCRLTEVASTEAVAIGDGVYTDSLVTPTGIPVYIGRVTAAEVEPSAVRWTIAVEPAAGSGAAAQSLQVLRVELNPERLARRP